MGTSNCVPLGVAMGNALSVTRVWRYICKNTNCWPATVHDVTTGATTIKGPPGEYIILFFVFTDWSVWSVHSGRNTVVLYLSWRALVRRSRSVWIRVPAIWHPMTHTIVASFVWGRGAMSAMSLRGQSACIVSGSLWKSSALVCPYFRGNRVSHLFPAIRDPPWPRYGG